MSSKPLFSNRQLFSLLWPLIMEQLLAVFVGMADVLMVSFVGESAMSGVSLVDSVNILVIQVLLGLTTGGTVVCAKAIGSHDTERAARSGAQLLSLTLLTMLMLSAVLLSAGTPLLSFIFGTIEESVMDNAVIYLRITTFSLPCLAVYYSGAAILRSAGMTRSSLAVSLIMNAVNIAGNAICVFGLKMGVAGVAIPTVCARVLAAGIVLIVLQKRDCPVRIRRKKDLIPNAAIIRNICSIGIPSGMESGIFQFGKLVLQSLVSTMGTASIAAFAVASNLVTYLYLPGNALGAGMMTVVGQCVGAGEEKQARAYAWKLVRLNYILLALICTGMVAARGLLVSWYHLSPESAAPAMKLLLAHSIAMVIWPVAFLLPNYFRATGHAAFTMIVSIATMWIFRVGMANVFVRVLKMDILGVWYAMFVDWGFRAAIFLWKYAAAARKKPLPQKTAGGTLTRSLNKKPV